MLCTISNVGSIYTLGMLFIAVLMLEPVIWLIKEKIFTKALHRFKHCISVSDIMEDLYGSIARWVTNLSSFVLTTSVIIIQIYIVKKICYSIFGKSDFLNPIFICIIVLTLYSIFGGIRSVIFTDVFQFAVFYIIIPVTCFVMLQNVGTENLFSKNYNEKDLFFSLNKETTLLFFSFIFLKFVSISSPCFIQRILAGKDKQHLNKALLLCGVISIPFIVIIVLLAFIIRFYLPYINSENAFIHFINILPFGIKGMFIIAIIAVVMSTIDSYVHYGGIFFAHDICKQLIPNLSKKTELFIAKIATLIIGSVSTIFIFTKSENLNVIWYGYNLWGTLILVPMIIGFLGFKTTPKVFTFASITGMLFTLCTAYFYGRFYIISLFMGILGNFLGFFGGHYISILNKGNKSYFAQIHYDIIIYIESFSIKKCFSAIKSFIQLLIIDSKESLERNEEQLYTFSIFAILYYLVPLFTEGILYYKLYVAVFYFKVVAFLLCVLLCFYEYWPIRFRKKYLASYWLFTLFFCLSFLPSYMTFVTEGKNFWLFNLVISTFLLAILINWRGFTFMFLLGMVIAYFADMLTEGKMSHTPEYNIYIIAYIYALIAVIGIIFFHSKNKEQEEKLSVIKLFRGAIAHEVKSPIAAIYMLSQAFNEIAKDVIMKVKKTNINEEAITFSMQEFEYKMLIEELQQGLLNSTKQTKNIIETILMPIRANIAHDLKSYSMSEIVEESILDYGLSDYQQKTLSFNKKGDFNFLGSKNFMKQVILNLMKNAYKYGGNDVVIKIWMRNNKLYFKDNGRGIESSVLPYIFDKFFTTTQRGSGIGLAFCKIIMESIGGKIECYSKLGKYTEFILTFQKIKPLNS